MEIEPYSFLRNQSKQEIDHFSCLRNRSNLDNISYNRGHTTQESFQIPSVPIFSNEHSPRGHLETATYLTTSSNKMVVDLQSQTPCVVTADPSAQSSPHDYKMLPQEVSPRRGGQDYKLIQQHLSPTAAVHRQSDLSPRMHNSSISPRSTTGDLNHRQQEQLIISPKILHDNDLVNQNISPHSKVHDIRILPPSPDNGQTVESDIPDNDTMTPTDQEGNKFVFGDYDAMDQTSESSSTCQSPEKHRNRRKQTIEDIIRRMKPVNGYLSNESEEEEELDEDEMADAEQMMRSVQQNLANGTTPRDKSLSYDEVDGDATPITMSGLRPSDLEKQQFLGTPHKEAGEKRKHSEMYDIPYRNGSSNLDTENIHPDNQPEKHVKLENGLELSPDHKQINAIMDRVAEITGSVKGGQENGPLPKMNGNWFHGAFGNLPLPFPFPTNPLEHHLNPNFLPRMENNFPSTQEVEKDYLKCQYCERTFRRQKNLENHVENTHHGKSSLRRKSEGGSSSGDMYFKCTHCPYTTKHQSNLYVHLRIHTGKNSFGNVYLSIT